MLNGKKTYIIALLAIAGAWGAYAQGDATLADTITRTVEFLLAMTIRHGIARKT